MVTIRHGATVESPSPRRAHIAALVGTLLAGLAIGAPGASAQWATNGANISYTSGNVGVGTTNPQSPLHTRLAPTSGLARALFLDATGAFSGTDEVTLDFRVFDGLNIANNPQGRISLQGDGNYSGNLLFYTQNSGTYPNNLVERMRITSTGNVGVGTASPVRPLHVRLTPASGLAQALILDANGTFGGHDEVALDFRVFDAANPSGSPQGRISLKGTDNYSGAILFSVQTGGTYPNPIVERMRITSNGNVGIGTTTPAVKLHVAGDTMVDGNIGAKYQDIAEWVKSEMVLPAATVVIVNPREPNTVTISGKAYDTRVAGVVSRKPGLLLGEGGRDKTAVAHSGRVKVKADATHGPIAVGDLLVTSPTPGYAMRSEPMDIGGTKLHRPGTLIGKALEPLEHGQAEILVLLTLQ